MKSNLYAIVILFFFCLVSTKHYGYAAERKELLIGVGDDPLFEFVAPNGGISGYCIDLSKAIMSKWGREYYFVIDNYLNNLQKLETEKVDLILTALGTTASKNGTQKCYSVPVGKIKFDLISRVDNPYRSIEELADKRIIVKSGTHSHGQILQLGGKYGDKLITVVTRAEGLRLLADGRADAMLSISPISRNLILENDIENLVVFDSGIPEQDIAFKSKDAHLIFLINEALVKLQASNEYERINHRWFGENNNDAESHNLIICLLITIAVIFILCLAVFRYRVRSKRATADIAKLNVVLDILNQKSNIEIYLYNRHKNKLYMLKNGKFRRATSDLVNQIKLIHPDDKENYEREDELTKSGRIGGTTTCFRMFDNQQKRYLDYEFVVSPLQYDADGNVIKYIFSKRDITDQKERIHQQQEIINGLKFSMAAVKFFYWKLDIATNTVQRIDDNFVARTFSIDEIKQSIKESDRDSFLAFYKELVETRKRNSIVLHIKQWRNSDYAPYVVTAGVEYGDNGEPAVIYGTSKDISDLVSYEVQLEEKIVLLEAIKKYLPVGLCFFDKEGRLCEINDKMVDMFGIDPSKMLETPLVMSELDYIPHNSLSNLCLGQSLRFELSYKRFYDSLSRYINDIKNRDSMFDVKYSPVYNQQNEIIGYLSIYDDKTEEYQLMMDLITAKNKAVESERLKMAFLANMSHEIRTPLNSIVGFSDILQVTDNEDEKQEYMRIINLNTELLLRLINDILDLSKIESGILDLKTEYFDLSVVLDETYKQFNNKHNNRDVQFLSINPYQHCFVTTDKNRLVQVGMNFLTNAFKYTEKGCITMGYEYVNGGIRIYVKDTGVGIKQECVNLVFERFEKLDSFVQGIGLGLSICKAIMEALGGKIGVDSEYGIGSTFWAWFPCEAEVIYKQK